MEREERSDRFTAVEDRFAGYTVYDQHYEKIGKVDDLFVDESDQPEYIGVKMGFLGTRSTLIPMDMVRVNDQRQLVEVASDKDRVKYGPTFDDDREITPDFESQVYSYYGLSRSSGSEGSGSYGSYYSEGSTDAGTAGPGMSMGRSPRHRGEGLRAQRRGQQAEGTAAERFRFGIHHGDRALRLPSRRRDHPRGREQAFGPPPEARGVSTLSVVSWRGSSEPRPLL
jgi:hypothetical protein